MWCSRFLQNKSVLILIAAAALFMSTAHSVSAQNITASAVLQATNNARRAEGESVFSLDPELSRIAEERLQDMFRRSYFAHESPGGESAYTLAEDHDYAYAYLGENLALGWFEDAKEIVDAWMASPGHRKNLLQDEFSSIGIAV